MSTVTTPSISVPQWQLERCRRLHRICRNIEGRIQRGQSLRKSVRWFTWYWASRFYRCDKTSPAKFCAQTLLRIYYQWRDNGKSPDAIALRYRGTRPKLSPDALQRFLNAAIVGDARSFKAAWQRMDPRTGTPSAYHHALPPRIRRQLVQLFHHRRSAQRLANRLARQRL
ncbi:MAG: hypothetical protein JWQ04_3183 [Pedosphaera sp.]|nr:hypothetical protein [Pedosphaera sp.]